MTLEEQLKEEIVRQHGSVLAFSKAIGFKNSTIDSMLSRGLYNAGVGRVLHIFDALGVDTESLAVGRLIYSGEAEQKIPPTPAEPEQGEEEVFKAAEKLLVSLGYIKPGEDISDDDIRIVNAVLDILDAWFQEKR